MDGIPDVSKLQGDLDTVKNELTVLSGKKNQWPGCFGLIRIRFLKRPISGYVSV